MQKKAHVTRVSNQHASVTLLGVVMNVPDEEIHYLSAIGPKGALQSIWATLISRGKGTLSISSKGVYDGRKFVGYAFDSQYNLQGAKGMKAYWSPLPNTAWAHLVAVSSDVLDNRVIVATDPQGVYLVGKERKKRMAAAMPEFLRRFVAALNQHTDVPILEEWGEALFNAAIRQMWLKGLSGHGDALVAGWLDASTADVLGALRSHLGVGGEVSP